jgi:hypothetical protein
MNRNIGHILMAFTPTLLIAVALEDPIHKQLDFC